MPPVDTISQLPAESISPGIDENVGMVDCRRMDSDNRISNVDVSKLCRVCAVQNEHIIPIFEGYGLELEFQIKLKNYLSLEVLRDDALPHHLCLKCSNTLLAWHEFFLDHQEADKQLHSMVSADSISDRWDSECRDGLTDESSRDSVEIIETYSSKAVTPSKPDQSGGKIINGIPFLKSGLVNVSVNKPSPDKKQPEKHTNPTKEIRALAKSLAQPGRCNTSTVKTLPQSDRDNFTTVKILRQTGPDNTTTVKIFRQTGGDNITTVKKLAPSGNNNATTVKILPQSIKGNTGRVKISPQSSRDSFTALKSISGSGSDNTKSVKLLDDSGTSKPLPQPAKAAQNKENISRSDTNISKLPKSSSSYENEISVVEKSLLCLAETGKGEETECQFVSSVDENAIILLDNLSADYVPVDLFSIMGNDVSEPSPFPSETAFENATEVPSEEPYVRSPSPADDVGTTFDDEIGDEVIETNENASESLLPLLTVVHDDHRYSKAAKKISGSLAETKIDKADSIIKALRKAEKSGCFLCGKMITNKILLHAHERSHFRTTEFFSFNCTLCSKSFKTFEEMTLHRKEHQPKCVRVRKRIRKTKEPKNGKSPKKSRSKASSSGTAQASDGVSNPKKTKTKQKKDNLNPHIKCKICNRCFQSRLLLLVHQVTHTREEREKAFTCKTCGKGFQSSSSLRSHQKVHEGGPGHLCSHCGKVFKMRTSLVQHLRIVHQEPKPWVTFKCDYCPRIFTNRRHQTNHMHSHSGERPYNCDKCDKAFHSDSNLRQHMACHDEARPFMCHVCGKGFKWAKNLNQHVQMHNPSSERAKKTLSPVQCEVCGKTLMGSRRLKCHIRIFHTGERPRDKGPPVTGPAAPCSYCGMVFSNPHNLELHIQSGHLKEKRFQCDICGKKYSTKLRHQEHQRVHTGERPFSCELCGKTFVSLSNWHAHKSAHSDERPFQCMYCDKSFKRNAHLVTHVRSHTGEKPYLCDICNRGFAQKNDMTKHRNTHSQAKVLDYRCSLCDCTFKKKTELNRHMAQHTSDEQKGEEPEYEEDEEEDDDDQRESLYATMYLPTFETVEY